MTQGRSGFPLAEAQFLPDERGSASALGALQIEGPLPKAAGGPSESGGGR